MNFHLNEDDNCFAVEYKSEPSFVKTYRLRQVKIFEDFLRFLEIFGDFRGIFVASKLGKVK